MIHHQLPFQRRHGAAGAFDALADAAGNADGVEGAAVGEVEVVGIDEGAGIGDLAAERQGIARIGGAEAGGAF